MPRPVGFLRGTAFRRGVLGTSRNWFAVWAVLSVVRFLRQRARREPKVIETIELRPGQSVVISDTGVPREASRA